MIDLANIIMGCVVLIAVFLVAYKIDQMLADIRASKELLARIASGIDALLQQGRANAPKPTAPAAPPPRHTAPVRGADQPRRVIEILPPE